MKLFCRKRRRVRLPIGKRSLLPSPTSYASAAGLYCRTIYLTLSRQRRCPSVAIRLASLMPRKLRVGIIFGGRSGEHEVSLRSAASVLAAIDKKKYEVVPIGIAKTGHWLLADDARHMLDAGTNATAGGGSALKS